MGKNDVRNWKGEIKKLAEDFHIDSTNRNRIIATVIATKLPKETAKSMYQRAWTKLFRLM